MNMNEMDVFKTQSRNDEFEDMMDADMISKEQLDTELALQSLDGDIDRAIGAIATAEVQIDNLEALKHQSVSPADAIAAIKDADAAYHQMGVSTASDNVEGLKTQAVKSAPEDGIQLALQGLKNTAKSWVTTIRKWIDNAISLAQKWIISIGKNLSLLGTRHSSVVAKINGVKSEDYTGTIDADEMRKKVPYLVIDIKEAMGNPVKSALTTGGFLEAAKGSKESYKDFANKFIKSAFAQTAKLTKDTVAIISNSKNVKQALDGETKNLLKSNNAFVSFYQQTGRTVKLAIVSIAEGGALKVRKVDVTFTDDGLKAFPDFKLDITESEVKTWTIGMYDVMEKAYNQAHSDYSKDRKELQGTIDTLFKSEDSVKNVGGYGVVFSLIKLSNDEALGKIKTALAGMQATHKLAVLVKDKIVK